MSNKYTSEYQELVKNIDWNYKTVFYFQIFTSYEHILNVHWNKIFDYIFT